eukprot:jgi/Galph1/1220/GphlegSOOS_G5939.1
MGWMKKKTLSQEMVATRFQYLWEISLSYATTIPIMSRYYVSIIQEMGRRLNYRLDSSSVKSLFCKECNSVLIPGKTVRIRKGRKKGRSRIVYSCQYCDRLQRYTSEAKKNRKEE